MSSFEVGLEQRTIGLEREYGPALMSAKGETIKTYLYGGFLQNFTAATQESIEELGLDPLLGVRLAQYDAFGRSYIDGSHPEISLSERSIGNASAAIIGADYLVLRAFERKYTEDNFRLGNRRIFLPIRSTAPDGVAWAGLHANFLTEQRLFNRRHSYTLPDGTQTTGLEFADPKHRDYLASWIVLSSLVFGTGTPYSDSDQRLQIHPYERLQSFSRLTCVETRAERPILNMRDEAHAGNGQARLHVISFDAQLREYATRTQLAAFSAALRTLELQAASDVMLDDPLQTLHMLKVDPASKVRMRDGRELEPYAALREMVRSLQKTAATRDFPEEEIDALDELHTASEEFLDPNDERKRTALLLSDWLLKRLVTQRKNQLPIGARTDKKGVELAKIKFTQDFGYLINENGINPQRINKLFRDPEDTERYLRAYFTVPEHTRARDRADFIYRFAEARDAAEPGTMTWDSGTYFVRTGRDSGAVRWRNDSVMQVLAK